MKGTSANNSVRAPEELRMSPKASPTRINSQRHGVLLHEVEECVEWWSREIPRYKLVAELTSIREITAPHPLTLLFESTHFHLALSVDVISSCQMDIKRVISLLAYETLLTNGCIDIKSIVIGRIESRVARSIKAGQERLVVQERRLESLLGFLLCFDGKGGKWMGQQLSHTQVKNENQITGTSAVSCLVFSVAFCQSI